MHKKLLIASLLLLIAVPAIAQTSFRCESQDGKYHECRLTVPGTVSLTNTISESACIEGRTWGFKNGVLWVDHGCRAEFSLNTPLNSFVRCESVDGKPTRCGVDTGAGVRLVRQISESECRLGRDWGYDENGIWVMSGCRAEFAVRAPVRTSILLCESENNTPSRCKTDTSHGVSLTRQLSENACVMNHTWGYDANGIWVKEGCRGEFAVGLRTPIIMGAQPVFVLQPVAQTQPPITQPITIQHVVQPVIVHTVATASGPSTLLCESQNNGLAHCKTDTTHGITLKRQISDNPCILNESWGYDSKGIWVRDGCRGEFIQGSVMPVMISSGSVANSLICESIEGRRNHCATNTSAGVRLLRQISDTDCQLNRTWGYDANGIWVTGGCRAEFALGGMVLPDVPAATSILCESKDGKRSVCAADTRLGVAVVKQLSDSPCKLNSTWGFDAEGIWVTAGCRAQFILRK